MASEVAQVVEKAKLSPEYIDIFLKRFRIQKLGDFANVGEEQLR